MSLFPKAWRPNRSNPDLEIIEREYAGRRAELRERHAAELALLDAKLADRDEHLAILNGLLDSRKPLLKERADLLQQLSEAKKTLVGLAAVQEAHDVKLAAAKVQAHQRAIEMCHAAGIEIPPTTN
jgi:hypothetical protein